jgi:diguanylate cyclase (GGDEF)-like protein
LPVYRPGEPHTTLEQRRENLMGFVLGVFQTSVMVETILRSVRSPTDLYLFEPGSGPDAMPVYIHSSKMRTRPAEPKPLGELTSQFHRAGELRVGDRQWTLLALPIPSGAIAKHLSAWIMLLAGIATTGIIVTFMVLSSRHTQMLVRANRKVSELARTDALTRLPNRRAFVDRLNEAFAASRRNAGAFAVLYFDLDHFKDVNDTLGHPTGDLLLLQVAARLQSVVRATDVVARFGGDEFAVLQSDASDLATTSILARKIVEALAAPYNLNGNEVHTTASAGIAIGSAGQGDSDSVMRQADLALYRAKADGRNCFRFHSEHFDREVRERVSIADDLRLAIDRDELELHYQPQVELKSGRITGLEALLRWNHPMRGTISPVTFIPIAERTGSIVQLGRWVLEEACRQLRTWQDDGIAPDLLGVNVSAIQCRQTDFQRDVLDCLARWKIDPAMLEIELTESVLMEGTQQQRGIVERLRQIGLRIAIDDFGTGYSSLAYLTNYPVDRLKIAQELVIKVNEDKRHQVVVRAAIRLAEELGVKLIAEGVQTKAQVDFLMASGCEYAQGFYYSRPVTAEHATELLRQRVITVAEPPARSKPRAVA